MACMSIHEQFFYGLKCEPSEVDEVLRCWLLLILNEKALQRNDAQLFLQSDPILFRFYSYLMNPTHSHFYSCRRNIGNRHPRSEIGQCEIPCHWLLLAPNKKFWTNDIIHNWFSVWSLYFFILLLSLNCSFILSCILWGSFLPHNSQHCK